MSKKLEELSNIELFNKFYSQSLTASEHIQKALIGACCDVTRSVIDGNGMDCSTLQSIVTFMESKDPENKLVQTNSILLWITDIAGFRVSNIGKRDEPSVVRPSRSIEHNEAWLSRVRADVSWAVYGKRKQEPKPMTDPTPRIVRELAAWVAMGGADLSELEVGMPAVVGAVKHMLKDPKFTDKIEDRMKSLDEREMEYIKV